MGEWFSVKTFTVDIRLNQSDAYPITLPAIQVVADDRSNEIILGRNVLNRLHLCLDGPKLKTEIID